MSLFKVFNTLKYLSLRQLFSRICKRFWNRTLPTIKTKPFKIENATAYIKTLHSNSDYLNRFSFDLKKNTVCLLNELVELDYFKINRYSPLIQFNIQYFEYAIAWAQAGVPFEYFKGKWKEYIDSKTPLEPYVISLQMQNIIIALNIYEKIDNDIFNDLHNRYIWLISHQETDLLANHYFENLKAIVIMSYIFSDYHIHNKYKKRLLRECKKEILNDGVHFELSFMYHKLILEDLLLVKKICQTSVFDAFIQSMLNAIYYFEVDSPRTLLFNDSGDNVAKSTKSLIDACREEFSFLPSNEFLTGQSGYYKISDESVAIIIDSGIVGPNCNPGHSHCDCLSFELFFKSKPLFVNSGTYKYQDSSRLFFRSTEAHNTVVIGDRQQSQIWGDFRVAKRIKIINSSLAENAFVGEYVNYCGEKHKRKITYSNCYLEVVDIVNSKKKQTITSYLHMPPSIFIDNNIFIGDSCTFQISTINCDYKIIDYYYSDEFGKIEKAKCLVFEWSSDEKEHGYRIAMHERK